MGGRSSEYDEAYFAKPELGIERRQTSPRRFRYFVLLPLGFSSFWVSRMFLWVILMLKLILHIASRIFKKMLAGSMGQGRLCCYAGWLLVCVMIQS